MVHRSLLVLVGSIAVLAGCTGAGPSTGASTGSSPAASTTSTTSTTSTAPVVAPNAAVASIVDGDTIDVLVDGREERVRLIGIDTPEIAHPSSGDRPGNPAECFGDEAKQFTATLLEIGAAIRLERDIVARDDYGRLLAYVHRAGDGIFVNYEIVRQGYAQPLTIAPNDRFAPLFVEAAQLAEADEAGLWSACGDR
jgi:micrococcal nuclease